MAGKLGIIIKFVRRWNGAQCQTFGAKKCKLTSGVSQRYRLTLTSQTVDWNARLECNRYVLWDAQCVPNGNFLSRLLIATQWTVDSNTEYPVWNTLPSVFSACSSQRVWLKVPKFKSIKVKDNGMRWIRRQWKETSSFAKNNWKGLLV